MSLQVTDPRSHGRSTNRNRSKSPSFDGRARPRSRDTRRRPSPSPSPSRSRARSPAVVRRPRSRGSSDSAEEDRWAGSGSRDTTKRRERERKSTTSDRVRYEGGDLGLGFEGGKDGGYGYRYPKYGDGGGGGDGYYHSDSGEEKMDRLAPGYHARGSERWRPSRRRHRPSSVYDDYSGVSASDPDDSLDDGLAYGDGDEYGDEDDFGRPNRLAPSSRPSRRRSRRRSSSRVRMHGSENENDAPGSHPSYAAPGRFKYADPAQYAYVQPGATRPASYTGAPTSTASQSNWAPIPECEMPGFVPERQGGSMPGAFPGDQLDESSAQNPTFPKPQYMNPAQQQNLYASSVGPGSHQRTSSDTGPRPIYANPTPFQYAQVDPNVRYGSKTTTVPYSYSTAPQFSKPTSGQQQYVEIAPGKRPSRPHSLSVSSANNLAVAGPEPGRRPASPMLEPYKGTYQSISPMPSPIMPSSKLDEDVSDLEPLDASDTGKRKKDKRKTKDKERKGEKGKSKRDKSSTRHDRHDSHDQQMVLVSPSSRKRVSFYDPVPDAMEMRDALSHTRNIDTKTLIYILPHLPSEDMLDLRKEYKNHVKLHGKGINMAKHLRLKLGGSSFGKVCYATALGRWESEAFWANCYYQSSTSRRELLIESLTGRSNSEIAYIKDSFRDSRYADSLDRCMKTELKADKFRTAVLLSLEERRQSEREPIDPDLVHDDVRELHAALTSRDGGETAMIYIIVLRSDNHLREVLRSYEKRYGRNFARDMIAKSQNLVGETLAHILNGVINRPMRDALLLHQALRESRTGKERSELLISRLVRLHWEPRHLEMVKIEFQKRYGEMVEEAIAEEVLSTNGGSDWGEFCIELARSSGVDT